MVYSQYRWYRGKMHWAIAMANTGFNKFTKISVGLISILESIKNIKLKVVSTFIASFGKSEFTNVIGFSFIGECI